MRLSKIYFILINCVHFKRKIKKIELHICHYITITKNILSFKNFSYQVIIFFFRIKLFICSSFILKLHTQNYVNLHLLQLKNWFAAFIAQVFFSVYCTQDFALLHLQVVLPYLEFTQTKFHIIQGIGICQVLNLPIDKEGNRGENETGTHISLYTVFHCYSVYLH